jgi:hypothetical protein
MAQPDCSGFQLDHGGPWRIAEPERESEWGLTSSAIGGLVKIADGETKRLADLQAADHRP